jgi:hypothetical protein
LVLPLALTVWIPTALVGTAGAGPLRSAPVPTVIEQVSNLPGYDIIRPEHLRTRARLPVIVWANGGCVRFNVIWRPLLQSWAAAGYVVVAIGTPAGADPRTAPPSTADDQAKAIDWAYAENHRASSPYAGHLDTRRIVAAGNSCGGITTLALASRDRRVRSVFVLSGSSVLPGAPSSEAARIMGSIRAPVGYVIGGLQDISTAFATRDYDLAAAAGLPVMLAHRSEGDHLLVSTNVDVLTEVAQISTKWIDLSLGKRRAKRKLLHNPCSTCPGGTWTVQAENLNRIARLLRGSRAP